MPKRNNANNPDTSDESKQHSKDVLDQEYNGGDIDTSSGGEKNPNNVAGGLKAYVFPHHSSSPILLLMGFQDCQEPSG